MIKIIYSVIMAVSALLTGYLIGSNLRLRSRMRKAKYEVGTFKSIDMFSGRSKSAYCAIYNVLGDDYRTSMQQENKFPKELKFYRDDYGFFTELDYIPAVYIADSFGACLIALLILVFC